MSIGTGLFRLHRKVIDRDRGGVGLSCLRGALRAASGVYGLGVRARNALYRRGWLRAHRAEVPVISVGNITAGGTGKTPLVAHLARFLLIHNRRPVILSRGYGKHGDVDDENAMLGRLAEGIPVVVNPDRVEGAETAVGELDADVLILDDGFQHRRIHRDLDIVVIDATRPFGAGHLLPRGLLREPLKELDRADILLLNRSALVSEEERSRIMDRLDDHSPGAVTALCRNVPQGLRPVGEGIQESLGTEELARGRWAAFCGVGNPEGFRLTLEHAGCRPDPMLVFSDHEHYDADQVQDILRQAREAGCDRVVTTEKDAVKVARLLTDPADPPIYTLRTELEFIAGSTAFTQTVLDAIGERP